MKESANIKRYGLLLAKYAEIEGMKTANLKNSQNSVPPVYEDIDYVKVAGEIEEIVYRPDDLL